MNYVEFLDKKTQLDGMDGFEPTFMPDSLFPFQQALVEWAVRKGRAALYEDCGMGKSFQQLAWAENVRLNSGKPVLIVTPLAVSFQTVSEAEKFGIEAAISRTGKVTSGITVTNYERLHLFDRDNFGGVVCDESSAIKSFDGVRRQIVTDFMRKMRYRLLCTATAAPNDYIELGTSSEALGYLGHMDMLQRFFTNNQNTTHANRLWAGAEWRFKAHAEEPFWRWVASWSRAMRKPSDLGFDDGDFILPPLEYCEHIVKARTTQEGWLFDMPAIGLKEERDEQRRTIEERCEMAAELVTGSEQAIVWCHLNAEGKRLAQLIPDAIEVSGQDDEDAKEEALVSFAKGQTRVLVTKPKIGAFGLNLQNCHRIVYYPSHSFELWYQAIRRCWRYGQKYPVTVNVVTTEGGANTLKNLQRKADAADVMFASLVRHMQDALAIDRSVQHTKKVEVPSWLR